MAHRNIPIFIPHMGCPNQCVFCNQRSISGCREFQEVHVKQQIDSVLSTIDSDDECEIAFFGGSFTGIDRGLMIRLLELAEQYVRIGRVSSIRLSTRPDYINGEILEILSRYSVKHIELGLQSMNDEVLNITRRGHTAQCARRACREIVAAGFALVGQMMIGLPGATAESELATAYEICSLGASAARIYPTVVYYDTPLAQMTANGWYQPLTVTEAVQRSADVLRIFEEREIPCIRIGLCATEDLTDPKQVMAGPNHPALGEMVWNEYYYQKIYTALQETGLLGQEVVLMVPKKKVSKAVGQHRCNLVRLLRETNTRVKKTVGDEKLNGVVPRAWRSTE